MKQMKIKWTSTKDKLPKIGQEVLCFYTIGEFQYYEVGKITEIHTALIDETRLDQSISWQSQDGDVIAPTHWHPLNPPDLCSLFFEKIRTPQK